MEISVIYPNQLFQNNPVVSFDRKIYLLRHPIFFKANNYLFNKKKILLHLLSVQNYFEKLTDLGYEVQIIEENNYEKFKRNILSKVLKIHVCEINDHELTKELNSLKPSIQIYKSPMFYESESDNSLYFGTKKKYLLTNYYKQLRKKHSILMNGEYPVGNKWTYDLDNRKNIPKVLAIPANINLEYKTSQLSKFADYVNKNYKSNPGNTDFFNYPIDHKQAIMNYENFLEYKFRNFGSYQDAIVNNKTFLFHSNISSSLNIGLITPKEVIDKAIKFSDINNIPINSLEGFIRQILGWREFIKGLYLFEGEKQINSNYWSANNKLPNEFYNASTKILPLDDTIKKSLDYSYVHHIERLMILGNFMLLLEIHPRYIYKWFMEVFIDAYPWVMVSNIFGMSQFSDGGLMSTKPYISSSNYVIKMSNYKNGEWSDIWDALFWNFINKHKHKIKLNPRMGMMVRLLDKKSSDQIKVITNIADKYMSKIFS